MTIEKWANRKKELSDRICSIFLSKGILKFGDFVLHLNKRTKYYLDFRLLPSYPLEFEKGCDAYVEMIKNEVPKVCKIAGVAAAALPFSIIVCRKLNLPHLLIEKLEYGGSLESPLSPKLKKDEQVLLLDDATASGVTLLLTADVIHASGGVVRDAVVLVDRQEGAKELLGKAGIKLHYLLTIQEIIDRKVFLGTPIGAKLKAV